MPTAPNYKKNLGRLVTDRYDFESHTNGSSFKHKAKNIDLENTLVIGPTFIQVSNVQEAVENIITIINAPLPEATQFQKGIIRISGDISNPSSTSDNIIVSGIRNRLISNETPANDQVLTWDQSTNSWRPKTPIPFYAAGDLYGTSQLQYVHQLTGTTGATPEVNIIAEILKFNAEHHTRFITQADGQFGPSSSNIIIRAQSASSLSPDSDISGGYVDIQGGSPKGSNQPGGVLITVDGRDDASVMFEAVKFSNGVKFISLFGNTKITESIVPITSGNMFLFFKETNSEPNGAPPKGAFLYSKNGRLYIREGENSENPFGPSQSFAISTIDELPETMVWGYQSGFRTISKKYYKQTTNIQQVIDEIELPENVTVRLDAICVARDIASTSSYQINMTMGYTTDGSAIIAEVGTILYSDLRTNISPSLIVPPVFDFINNKILIKSGYDAASPYKVMNWIIVLQTTYMQGSGYP